MTHSTPYPSPLAGMIGGVNQVKTKICRKCGMETKGYGPDGSLCHTCTPRAWGRRETRKEDRDWAKTDPDGLLRQERAKEAAEDRMRGVMIRFSSGKTWP